MNNRKKLLILIKKTETKLHINKVRLKQHKGYFTQFIANNKFKIGIAIAAAAAFAWRRGKPHSLKRSVKKFIPLAETVFLSRLKGTVLNELVSVSGLILTLIEMAYSWKSRNKPIKKIAN